MSDFDHAFHLGYEQAMKDINTPMKVIIPGTWGHSICPRCGEQYNEYEENDDGYISRCTSMERCPYCGQRLGWDLGEIG